MKNNRIPNNGKLKRDPGISRTKWNTLFLIELKEALSNALSNTKIDRYDLAAKISRLLGEDIKPSYLYNVVATSREDLIPKANFVRAVCEVTGDNTPLLIMTTGVKNFHVIDEAAKLKLDLFDSKTREAAEKEKQEAIISQIQEVFKHKGHLPQSEVVQ